MSLSSTQYQNIMREYEKTRNENFLLAQERKEQIYEQIPEFNELDAAVANYASARVRLLLEDSPAAKDMAESPIPRIKARRKMLLTAAGYPADYLDPIYTCPACQDTGYVSLENGLKEKCECFKKKELVYLYEDSNLQGVLTTDRFSNLSYDYCSGEDLERLRGAVRISMNFVETFGRGENLLFYGTVGTGKSFLSGCIANALLEKGIPVVYFSAVGLFETLSRYTFDGNAKESLYNFCKELYNYDLVIVDDLGTELLSSFVTSQLFSFLNEREIRKKSTIISTNLNLSELRDRYSDRVFSRISRNFQLCKLTGPDVRMCQKLNSIP